MASNIISASGFRDLLEKLKEIKRKFVNRLHEAVYTGDRILLEEILSQHEVDINMPDDIGYTALHIASDNDEADVVNILLKYGASVDAQTNKGIRRYIYAKVFLRVNYC